ncbi:hypothetical protein, partial [Novacetimonas maltaceti]|uniref:hypothetical protein n=1 Tax=Novacetimonas maltaceti TaxID=1203393 RepID=UPI001CA57506
MKFFRDEWIYPSKISDTRAGFFGGLISALVRKAASQVRCTCLPANSPEPAAALRCATVVVCLR